MSTGLRIGEIIALQVEDIGQNFISVKHSYSRFDGLKTTKTDEARLVPLIPEIRDALLQLGSNNPHDNRFIFFCEKPNKPWDQEMPALALKKMLIKLHIGNKPLRSAGVQEIKEWKKQEQEAIEYWRQRNVVFHSWRHFYAARMAEKLKARQVMLTTGHKTEAVFWEYAAHALESELTEVSSIQESVFSKFLPDAASGIAVKKEIKN
jgi:integrase